MANIFADILKATIDNGETLEAIHETLELSGKTAAARTRQPVEVSWECPECGRSDPSVRGSVLTSFPSQLVIDCPDCGRTNLSTPRVLPHAAAEVYTPAAHEPGTPGYLNAYLAGARYAKKLASARAGRVESLSYIVRAQQVHGSELGRATENVIGTIFGGGAGHWRADWWSKTDMTLRLYSGGNDVDTDYGIRITYRFKGILQDGAGWTDGKEKIFDRDDQEQEGHAYLIELEGEPPGQPDFAFEKEDSVTIEQSSTTSMNRTTEIDIGSKATAGFEIGGEAAGGKVSAQLEASLDVKNTEEEAKEDAENTAVVDTIKIATAFESGTNHLAFAVATIIDSDRPRGWHGPWDAAPTIEVDLDALQSHFGYITGGRPYPHPIADAWQHGARFKTFNRSGHRWGRWAFASMDELVSAFQGTDTELPLLIDKPVPDYLSGWVKVILNPEHRRVELDGVQHRTYPDGSRFSVSDVSGQDPDDVIRQHGAVRVTRDGPQ